MNQKTKGNEVLIYPRSCINIENTLSAKKKARRKRLYAVWFHWWI